MKRNDITIIFPVQYFLRMREQLNQEWGERRNINFNMHLKGSTATGKGKDSRVQRPLHHQEDVRWNAYELRTTVTEQNNMTRKRLMTRFISSSITVWGQEQTAKSKTAELFLSLLGLYKQRCWIHKSSNLKPAENQRTGIIPEHGKTE